MEGVGDWFAATAYDGTLILAVPVAVAAGLISFFSPCVVPLLPGYLAYVTGLSGTDLGTSKRGRITLGTSLFVLGFSAVFVSFGAFFGQLGDWLFVYSRQISVILGALTVLVGFGFLGLIPWLQRDIRMHRLPGVGVAAAPMLGVLFGLGWTPCIGPTLAAVSSLAMNEASAERGALLSLAYALGLGFPFIVAGIAFRRALAVTAWVRSRQVWVTRAGGLMLITVGLLLITGSWNILVSHLQGWVAGFSAPV